MYTIYFTTDTGTNSSGHSFKGRLWHPAITFTFTESAAAIAMARAMKETSFDHPREFAVTRVNEDGWIYKTDF